MKHLLLLIVAVSMLTAITYAQQSGDMEFLASVAAAGGPLTIDASTGPVWEALKPGTAYTCIADEVVNVANITPYTDGQGEAFTPGELVVTGGPGMDVVLTFVMPTVLYPSAGIGRIYMTYDGQSCSVVDANGTGLPIIFFNPLTPYTVQLNADGEAYVWVGGNPSVSGDASEDDFLGYALIAAEYVGF